jgi:hypothetical protein
MNNMIAVTHSGEKKVVTDYKVVNQGSIMNPEMYIDSVEVDGIWIEADLFKTITFERHGE